MRWFIDTLKESLTLGAFVAGLMLLFVGILTEQPILIIISILIAVTLTWIAKRGKA